MSELIKELTWTGAQNGTFSATVKSKAFEDLWVRPHPKVYPEMREGLCKFTGVWMIDSTNPAIQRMCFMVYLGQTMMADRLSFVGSFTHSLPLPGHWSSHIPGTKSFADGLLEVVAKMLQQYGLALDAPEPWKDAVWGYFPGAKASEGDDGIHRVTVMLPNDDLVFPGHTIILGAAHNERDAWAHALMMAKANWAVSRPLPKKFEDEPVRWGLVSGT